ncbi:interleukin-13 receptor subunit alpha-2 isoform X2 [Scophthalmus maximus]|uniref:interleukin-13 receptor subunit alpha-2 isoform X2 n=1 Tax=Scophthalmus maximus TaxID=52904 RepID=UPI0015E1560E|nr:interleukin-13 receptor subunit alpha-2 isoform X2 [Scophthalmus maximus]
MWSITFTCSCVWSVHLLRLSIRRAHMMGRSRSSVTHGAALMLLFITCRECTGFTVDPPEDLVIFDPGHLGHLEIRWSPPARLINKTECPKHYQLEYFSTYKGGWTAIRTPGRSYSAQFDLMKDIRVKVFTLLSGPCTNGTMVKSKSYTELVQKPLSTGVEGTRVKDFICVFHKMENMECKWGRSAKMPATSQQNLYFWHKQLEHAEECPEYIISGGVRIGCNFTGKVLPDFTDINFCINGSSAEGALKPTFISLQIQNHVKPGATEKLYLRTAPDTQLELHWECPVGSVPEHCLEWEVEHSQEGPDGKIASQILTQQKSLTLPLIHDDERNCFRVRSQLHKYCVDKSYWSEWSLPNCYPEMKEVTPEPEWDMVRVYVYIAVAITAMLVLSLCLGTMIKVRSSRPEKKQDPLHTTLLVRNSVLRKAEA